MEVKNAQRSSKTLRMYGDGLRYFREFSLDAGILTCGSETPSGRWGDRPVDSFDRQDSRVFFAGLDGLRKRLSRDPRPDRIGRPLSAISRHAYARVLRAFWRWCLSAEVIQKPVPVVMPKIPQKEIPALPDDAIERMLATARKHKTESLAGWRNYVFSLLLAYTGARRNEILALRVEDVELDREPPSIVIRHGKGDKERRVVIHPDVRGELIRYVLKLRTEGIEWIVFSDRSPNRSLTSDAPYRILVRIAVEAGFRANLVSPGSAVFACVDSMHVRRQIFRDFQEHNQPVFTTQFAELHNDQTLPTPPCLTGRCPSPDG